MAEQRNVNWNSAGRSPAGSAAAAGISLFIAGAFALATTSDEPWFRLAAALGCSGFSAFVAVWGGAVLRGAALGFLLVVLPFFGSSALEAAALAYGASSLLNALLIRRRVQQQWIIDYSICAAAILAGIYFGSALRTLFETFDRSIFSSVVELGHFRAYLLHNRPVWYRALLEAGGWIISCVLCAALVLENESLDLWQGLKRGVSFGFWLSCVAVLAQALSVHPFFDLNRGPFFISIGRYAGTFSDPNAFGVAAAIIVPIGLREAGSFRSWLLWAAFGLIALWSGSRSYVLGLALALALFLAARLPKPFRVLAAVFLLAGLSGMLLVLRDPAVNASVRNRVAAPALQRAIESIEEGKSTAMFFSRAVYLRLGLELWREHQVFGAGLGRFYDEQGRLANVLGIDLGEWRDNANNFYVQVLAEQGLIGALAILAVYVLLGAAVRGGRSERVPRGALQAALVVLALLLFTGPHLAFAEIRFAALGIAAILSASGLRAGGRGWSIRTLAMTCIFGAALFAVPALWAPPPPLRGFYPPEESEGRQVAWTAKAAALRVCPGSKPDIEIRYRALNPDLWTKPVSVRWKTAFGETAREIRTPGWQRERIRLPVGCVSECELSVSTDRVWTPSAKEGSSDNRALGVMVELPGEVCTSQSR